MPAHGGVRPSSRRPVAGARTRPDGGYSRVEWLVIVAVILVIVAGAVLLVRLVVSSLSAEPIPSSAPSAAAGCSATQWFDASTGGCVPRADCAPDETYELMSNTCTVVPPKPTAIAPSSGLSTGGTEVRITGSGFAEGVAVTIDGTPALDVQRVSDEVITATTPGSENLYPVDVEVANPSGATGSLDNAFTYVPVPQDRLTDVLPAKGSSDGGEAVIIKGTGFVEGAKVAFFGRPATEVVVLDDTTIRAITPAGPLGPVTVNVRLPNEAPFTLEDGFTYVDQAPRRVESIRPAKGRQSGGTKVTIIGSGFADGATVAIGGKSARKVTVVSSTTITAVTPPGTPGPAAVAVRNPDLPAAILADGFTYLEAPEVLAVAPAEGPETGGEKVTITGTGFLIGAKVTFGDVPATSIKVVSPTRITAVTPPGEIGVVPVTVENPDQPAATLKRAYTYVNATMPEPTPSPSAPALPRCRALQRPPLNIASGDEMTLTSSAIFPSSIPSPRLVDASYVGDFGSSVLWQTSPAQIFFEAGDAGSVGSIEFSYRSPGCQGTGTGSIPVSVG